MPDGRPGVVVVRGVIDLLERGEAVVAIGVTDIGYVLARTSAPLVTARVQAPATKRPTDPPARKSEISVTMGAPHVLPERFQGARPTIGVARAAGEWARQRLVDEVSSE